MSSNLTTDQVKVLARCADLELGDERATAAAQILNAWVPAANEVSRKMAAPEYDNLTPITVLVHPQPGEKKD